MGGFLLATRSTKTKLAQVGSKMNEGRRNKGILSNRTWDSFACLLIVFP